MFVLCCCSRVLFVLLLFFSVTKQQLFDNDNNRPRSQSSTSKSNMPTPIKTQKIYHLRDPLDPLLSDVNIEEDQNEGDVQNSKHSHLMTLEEDQLQNNNKFPKGNIHDQQKRQNSELNTALRQVFSQVFSQDYDTSDFTSNSQDEPSMNPGGHPRSRPYKEVVIKGLRPSGRNILKRKRLLDRLKSPLFRSSQSNPETTNEQNSEELLHNILESIDQNDSENGEQMKNAFLTKTTTYNISKVHKEGKHKSFLIEKLVNYSTNINVLYEENIPTNYSSTHSSVLQTVLNLGEHRKNEFNSKEKNEKESGGSLSYGNEDGLNEVVGLPVKPDLSTGDVDDKMSRKASETHSAPTDFLGGQYIQPPNRQQTSHHIYKESNDPRFVDFVGGQYIGNDDEKGDDSLNSNNLNNKILDFVGGQFVEPIIGTEDPLFDDQQTVVDDVNPSREEDDVSTHYPSVDIPTLSLTNELNLKEDNERSNSKVPNDRTNLGKSMSSKEEVENPGEKSEPSYGIRQNTPEEHKEEKMMDKINKNTDSWKPLSPDIAEDSVPEPLYSPEVSILGQSASQFPSADHERTKVRDDRIKDTFYSKNDDRKFRYETDKANPYIKPILKTREEVESKEEFPHRSSQEEVKTGSNSRSSNVDLQGQYTKNKDNNEYNEGSIERELFSTRKEGESTEKEEFVGNSYEGILLREYEGALSSERIDRYFNPTGGYSFENSDLTTTVGTLYTNKPDFNRNFDQVLGEASDSQQSQLGSSSIDPKKENTTYYTDEVMLYAGTTTVSEALTEDQTTTNYDNPNLIKHVNVSKLPSENIPYNSREENTMEICFPLHKENNSSLLDLISGKLYLEKDGRKINLQLKDNPMKFCNSGTKTCKLYFDLKNNSDPTMSEEMFEVVEDNAVRLFKQKPKNGKRHIIEDNLGVMEGQPITEENIQQNSNEINLVAGTKNQPALNNKNISLEMEKVSSLKIQNTTLEMEKEPSRENQNISLEMKKEPNLENQNQTLEINKEPVFENQNITLEIEKEPSLENENITLEIKKEPVFENQDVIFLKLIKPTTNQSESVFNHTEQLKSTALRDTKMPPVQPVLPIPYKTHGFGVQNRLQASDTAYRIPLDINRERITLHSLDSPFHNHGHSNGNRLVRKIHQKRDSHGHVGGACGCNNPLLLSPSPIPDYKHFVGKRFSILKNIAHTVKDWAVQDSLRA